MRRVCTFLLLLMIPIYSIGAGDNEIRSSALPGSKEALVSQKRFKIEGGFYALEIHSKDSLQNRKCEYVSEVASPHLLVALRSAFENGINGYKKIKESGAEFIGEIPEQEGRLILGFFKKHSDCERHYSSLFIYNR